jgi:hypothetical protein
MDMEMDTHMLHMGGEDGMGYDEQLLHERRQLQTGSGESRGGEGGEGVMQGELQEAL